MYINYAEVHVTKWIFRLFRLEFLRCRHCVGPLSNAAAKLSPAWGLLR